MNIVYTTKEQLSPAFGMYNYKTDTAQIRSDLPVPAKRFVIEHERGHAQGRGEIMATLQAIPKAPLGFLVTVVLSLSPSRLSYYWGRITNG